MALKRLRAVCKILFHYKPTEFAARRWTVADVFSLHKVVPERKSTDSVYIFRMISTRHHLDQLLYGEFLAFLQKDTFLWLVIWAFPYDIFICDGLLHLLLCPLKKARVADYSLTSAIVNLVTIRLFVAYDACF